MVGDDRARRKDSRFIRNKEGRTSMEKRSKRADALDRQEEECYYGKCYYEETRIRGIRHWCNEDTVSERSNRVRRFRPSYHQENMYRRHVADEGRSVALGKWEKDEKRRRGKNENDEEGTERDDDLRKVRDKREQERREREREGGVGKGRRGREKERGSQT